jgi:hypothetical protein
VLIVFIILIGCSSPDEPKVFVVEPADGISFKFEILEIHNPIVTKNKPENPHQSMYYRLTITNKRPVWFNPGNVKMRINGVENVYTGPNSLGSGEWATKAYPPGSHAFNSITYFPEELLYLKMEDIRTFSLVSDGLVDIPLNY